MATFTTVFLSSTARDLQPYRDAVAEAIAKMGGYHCVQMENFGPRNASAAEVCTEEVSRADVFVGLIGHLHGSRPKGSDLYELPEELRDLCRRQSISVVDQLFDASLKLLTRRIRELPRRTGE